LEIYQAYDQLQQTQFIGAHNAYNLWSSIQLVQHLLSQLDQHPSQDQRNQVIKNIAPLEHRLQAIKMLHNITIYDDNNSTNSSSLETALTSFDHPVILICGWSDKGDSFDHLKDLFRKNVAHACLIGYMSSVFAKLCEAADVPYTLCESLEPAVHQAYDLAKKNKSDTILFSPWCASFDQYLNYHERAAHFITLVDKLV
jgi:UDP-N-acetylmuramoylalanine--D-glutamate ligase